MILALHEQHLAPSIAIDVYCCVLKFTALWEVLQLHAVISRLQCYAVLRDSLTLPITKPARHVTVGFTVGGSFRWNVSINDQMK